jgi:hypothetical protein
MVIANPTARRCLILGDPGEADGSQYAVIDPMLAADETLASDFMVVLSDVIYPAGDVNDYVNGFYRAYADYEKPILALPEKPILALPGNHDWYDGLNGFMFHFCGAEALPPTEYRRSSFSAPERTARMLWRQADRPERARLLAERGARARRIGAKQKQPDAPWRPPQPGPYWAMDMDGPRLVAIDTGIRGRLDREQGEWLLRVSRADVPKVLLTGKPLWVNAVPRKTPIDWGEAPGAGGRFPDLDAVVRHRDFDYVACVGGDVHNYQHLSRRAEDSDREGGTVHYVVAGGAALT